MNKNDNNRQHQDILDLQNRIREIEQKQRMEPYLKPREPYFLGQHHFSYYSSDHTYLGSFIHSKDIDRINSVLKKEVNAILAEKKMISLPKRNEVRTSKYLVDMIISYAKMAEYKKSWKHKMTLQEVEYTKFGLLPDQALQFDISWKQLNLEQYIIKQKGGSNDD